MADENGKAPEKAALEELQDKCRHHARRVRGLADAQPALVLALRRAKELMSQAAQRLRFHGAPIDAALIQALDEEAAREETTVRTERQ